MKYFQDHRVGTQVFNLLGVIAAVLLILFAVRLREFLRDDGSDGGLLSTAAFGGALILAAGVMLDSAITFGLVRAARLNFAGPAETLNVLSNNDFYIIFGGIAILLLGAGIATVRRPALPRPVGMGSDRGRDPLPRWAHWFLRGDPCHAVAARGLDHHLPKGPGRGAIRHIARQRPGIVAFDRIG